VAWGVMVVGSMGDSSSEMSVMVKSDRVETLMDGEWVTGDAGTDSAFGAATGLSWGG